MGDLVGEGLFGDEDSATEEDGSVNEVEDLVSEVIVFGSEEESGGDRDEDIED